VVNALGVFNNAPLGAMAALEIEAQAAQVAMLIPVDIHAFGRDASRNRLPSISSEGVAFMSDPAYGFFHYGRYVPTRAGRHRIYAAYGAFTAYLEFYAMETAHLTPRPARIHTFPGARAPVGFTGLSACGNTIYVSRPTSLSVHPHTLGHFEGNYFVATGAGMGYIAAAIGNVRTYVALYVAEFPTHLLPWYWEMLVGTPYAVDTVEYVTAHPGLREWLAGGIAATAPEGTEFTDRGRVDSTWARGVRHQFAVPQQGSYGVRWGRFENYILRPDGQSIVLLLDRSPLAFTRRAEFYLLHDVLLGMLPPGGRAFVISPAAEGTALHIRDGVRYISTDSPTVTLFNYNGEFFWRD
jgi:hypothetical protein